MSSRKHHLYGDRNSCAGCRRHPTENEEIFRCIERGCQVLLDAGCANSPSEMRHPAHPVHDLKLFTSGPPGHTKDKCSSCGERLGLLGYHCPQCEFIIDTLCARNPPSSSVIDKPKCHEHSLTRSQIYNVSFTCDLCGVVQNGGFPYECQVCEIKVHEACINLPHVIKIISHQHRLSLTLDFRVPAKLPCGICYQWVDMTYGAYLCFQFFDYVAHSVCATNRSVWNGKDLKGEPEKGDNSDELNKDQLSIDAVKNRFSDQGHSLTFDGDNSICDRRKLCQACVLPIYSGPFYNCTHCDNFILHDKCAILPGKNSHPLHARYPLDLQVNLIAIGKSGSIFTCSACGWLCNGFSYKCGVCGFQIDARCSSVPDKFTHELHPGHYLYLSRLRKETCCSACGKRQPQFVLECPSCSFSLCFGCATSPRTVSSRYDSHRLTLHCHQEESFPYRCEICEGGERGPNKWYYACDECSVAAHIECALGNFRYVKPGEVRDNGCEYELVDLNHTGFKPRCHACESLRLGDRVAKISDKYFCSRRCALRWTSKDFPDIWARRNLRRKAAIAKEKAQHHQII